jgi:YihY family inner membrane protein
MANVSPASLVRAVDRFQQSHRAPGFVFGVIKKYGDDRAGSLAALVTYYGFLSVFPLLLVLVTVLGLLAGGSHRILQGVLHSALAEFPIIGDKACGSGLPRCNTDLAQNIHGLRAASPITLTIGLVGLLWGSLGASQAGMYAMAQVWNVPQVDRPGFFPRLGRSTMLLVVLAVFVGLSTFLSGIATFGGEPSGFARALGLSLSFVANIVLYVGAFRILTPKQVATRALVPGAVLGAFGWTVLQSLGSFLVGHELRHASQLYGFFGVVLGLMWWMFLGFQLTLYAAELNVVRTRRLWPRSIVQPPFTEADREMLTTYLREAQRRPEQRLSVGFRRHHRAPESPQPTNGGGDVGSGPPTTRDAEASGT